MGSYWEVTIKLALGLLTIIIQINLSGKSNLAPVSALDQVQNYVLGAIVGGMIYSSAITILQYFLVLLIWTLLVLILRFTTNHNRYIKKFIDGQPQIIITNGQLDVDSALKHGLSANDLSLKLRSSGVASLTDVSLAVLEQNGQLTVMTTDDEAIRYPMITDGQLNPAVLTATGHDEAWLTDYLKRHDYTITDIYLATYANHELYFFPYSK